MSRSRRKFCFFSIYSFKMTIRNKYTLKKAKNINRIRKKNSTIAKVFINKRAFLHKGKSILKKSISKLVVGKKYGEFILTRKPFFFPTRKKKKLRR